MTQYHCLLNKLGGVGGGGGASGKQAHPKQSRYNFEWNDIRLAHVHRVAWRFQENLRASCVHCHLQHDRTNTNKPKSRFNLIFAGCCQRRTEARTPVGKAFLVWIKHIDRRARFRPSGVFSRLARERRQLPEPSVNIVTAVENDTEPSKMFGKSDGSPSMMIRLTGSTEAVTSTRVTAATGKRQKIRLD